MDYRFDGGYEDEALTKKWLESRLLKRLRYVELRKYTELRAFGKEDAKKQ